MQRLSQHKISLFLLVFLAVFFCIYAYFNLINIAPDNNFFSKEKEDKQTIKFNSPDETANYFWLQRLAQGQPLYYFEPLNYPAVNLIHARSLNTVGGKITPGSFLGLPLVYGFLARWLGLSIVPYLTPFFSILALFFFYLLIKQLFKDKGLALLSAILLGFFPAWFYYSSRGMYHNILFISLFMIGVYLLFQVLSQDYKLKTKKLNIDLKFIIYNLKFHLFYFLSGLFIGLAIITRSSEIVWVAFTIILLLVFNLKKIYWPGFVMFLSGLWLPILWLFYHNQILYGSFISAGYRAVIPHGDIIQAASSGLLFKILITPFGFNLKSILVNAYNYLLKFLPAWSALALLGGLLFAVLPKKIVKLNYKLRWSYLFYYLIIGFYLIIFYGSWQFSDRIDGQLVSLGNSYLRYWLPIYVLAIPLVSFLILSCVKLVLPKINWRYDYYRLILLSIISLLLLATSFKLVILATDESLLALNNNLNYYRLQADLIQKITHTTDIVVIYPQADKIFFPQRKKIITALAVPADYYALSRLIKIRQLYYYTFAPPTTVKFISQRDFKPYGLKIVKGRLVLGHDWLYQIIKK